jgi:uncharacterized protein
MKLFGEDTVLTPLAQLIMNENIAALEIEKKNGWQINKPMQFGKYDFEPAIIFALRHKKINVIQWLIGKRANLNIMKNPAIIFAVYGGKKMLKLLLDNGADINAADGLTRNVVTIALYEKKFDLIPYLVQQGFDVKKDGRSLRQAVFSRQFKAVKMLLNLGFDPNFRERDQVHPETPSAVHIAARNKNDFKTVKLLVEHGADVTLKDNYGDRPFTAAMLNNDAPLMAYLKALEPAEWHDEDAHLVSLTQYNLPQSMLAICKKSQKSKRKISFAASEKNSEDYGVRYIVLHPTLLLKAFMFGKKELVEFIGETDNYETFLVWYPTKNCLAYIDNEHGEFKALGKWEDFIANPDAFYDKYLSKYF